MAQRPTECRSRSPDGVDGGAQGAAGAAVERGRVRHQPKGPGGGAGRERYDSDEADAPAEYGGAPRC
eukprot:scaffold2908_cov243-Prasinococcus_capsulatus_cf.AAC.1